MHKTYLGVTTRFLNENERLIPSDEKEMPLVIEALESPTLKFLHSFLKTHSSSLLKDISQYGAVLLRGFDIKTDADFEQTVLSIEGMKGIHEAFMSEEGRIHVDNLNYVLYTNAVYKTGGTLYLGGFHSENYYSADVPSYICFCCHQPSQVGGETGLINMEKVYAQLSDDLKKRLQQKTFFVSKWLLSEVQDRYHLSEENIEKICQEFDLPVVGKSPDRFILMYKPNIFENPETKTQSLQINFLELPTLNAELRKNFAKAYSGKHWFWHRLVWRLPYPIFKLLEWVYIIVASFFYSPKNSIHIFLTKIARLTASSKKKTTPFDQTRVGSVFKKTDVKELALHMRNYYSSCLWKPGDILLIDNKKVVHAGMPGAGPRLVRAMICNPIAMSYTLSQNGCVECKLRATDSVGSYMASGKPPF